MNQKINTEITDIQSIDRNVPTGWVCPTCKRVYAPFTLMCPYCGGNQARDFVTSDGPWMSNCTTEIHDCGNTQMICS